MDIPQLMEKELKNYKDAELYRASKKLRKILVDRCGLTVDSSMFGGNVDSVELYCSYKVDDENNYINFEISTEEEFKRWSGSKGGKTTIVEPEEVNNLFERVLVDKGFIQRFVTRHGSEYRTVDLYPTLTKEVEPFKVYYISWFDDFRVVESVKNRLK